MSISSPRTSKASRKPPVLTDPVRYPQSAPAPVRTKRAFVLLLMTLLVPGSAQIVAGNRKLGRAALRVTFAVWAVVVLAIVLALTSRATIITALTNPFTSLIVILVLVALALGWAFIFLNTLRIIRPGLLAPGMRGMVSGVLVLLMVLTAGSMGYAAYVINVGRNAISNIFSAGAPSMAPVDGRYNFLVMGGDAGADRVGRRPDSIIVVSVDASTGQAVTISIPRNLQNAQFPADSPMHSVYPQGYNCGDNCIINFLYTEVTQKYKDLYPGKADPGAAAMMDAASGTLGLKIQGYVLIDMAGFSKLIDALGGVKINAGGWVPISGAEIGSSDQHAPPEGWIAPGEQTLDGYHALWYSRSRQWVLEYSRSQRQQCIQQALLKQMDPATVLTKFESIANAGTQVMESDIPAAQLGSFVDLALKSKQHPLNRLTIGPPDFGINFPTYPDFGQIHAKVRDLISGKASSPVPSDASGAPAAPAPAAPAPGGSQPAPASQAPAPAAPDPSITEAYLQQLAVAGDDGTLDSLLSNNGNCTPG
ncbi:MAG: LCP family protein [Actinomycetota bacterium]|nr:LCP family protein [Actinomycetota bacterium]